MVSRRTDKWTHISPHYALISFTLCITTKQ